MFCWKVSGWYSRRVDIFDNSGTRRCNVWRKRTIGSAGGRSWCRKYNVIVDNGSIYCRIYIGVALVAVRRILWGDKWSRVGFIIRILLVCL